MGADSSESRLVKLRVVSLFAFVAGLLGCGMAATAVGVMPFAPYVLASALVMAASMILVVASAVVFCHTSPRTAHGAALFCLIVHLLCFSAILIVQLGTSHDFCESKVSCNIMWEVDDEAGNRERCYKSIHSKCDHSYSWGCFNLPYDEATATEDDAYYDAVTTLESRYGSNFVTENIGKANCEQRFERQCKENEASVGDKLTQFLGFSNRQSCQNYYKKHGKIYPKLSMAAVLSGALLQILASSLFLYHAVDITGSSK